MATLWVFLAFLVGWWLGRLSGRSTGSSSEPARLRVVASGAKQSTASSRTRENAREPTATKATAHGSTEDDGDDDDEHDDDDDSESDEEGERMKMVLVIRMDLDMGKGKIAAQCCHACLAAYETSMVQARDYVRSWERYGQTKVTLKCPSEDEMLRLESLARQQGLVAMSICDAGKTQIAAGSRTVLAIGPAPEERINKITGHLKLF